MMCAASRTGAAAEPAPEYVADALPDRIVWAKQGWGTLGLNTAVKPRNRAPSKLRIGKKRYARGLGMHANGELMIDLRGEFTRFEAEVGIQWHGGTGTSSVVFRVVVDGVKRFDSGVVRESDPPRKVSVPVAGAAEMLLVADSAGDGITCDVANWANARLVRDPNAKATQRANAVDIAQFARVVTWDPKWTGGKVPGRVAEFPADHLFRAADVAPARDGAYTVPAAKGGEGCIGLLWHEERFLREVSLEFADPTHMPPASRVKMQYWTGRSAWQGAWKPLDATLTKAKGRWTWRVAPKLVRHATQKVRWVFPASKQPVVVKAIAVRSASVWRVGTVRMECRDATAGKRARIEVYNGEIVSPPKGATPVRCTWDMGTPLTLKVRTARTWRCKTDRTVLRFRVPGTAPFAVAVEDVLADDNGVYLADAGVFVTADPPPVRLADYLKKVASAKTVLERVREMPEQTFAQAMAKTHNPIQDHGPMMVSLACDQRKFIAYRDGRVGFKKNHTPSRVFDGRTYRSGRRTYPCLLRPTFGDGKEKETARHLDGEWLPIPVTTVSDGDIVTRQRTYVAPVDDQAPKGAHQWLRRRAVCVVEYTIENTSAKARPASLALALFKHAKKEQLAKLEAVKEGAVATLGTDLLAFFDTRQAAPLSVAIEAGTVRLSGALPSRATARVMAYLPAWRLTPKDYAPFCDDVAWDKRLRAYWEGILAPAAQIEVPDTLLTHIIRASQVHCMLAAGSEENGQRIDVWTSANRYGALESESQPIIRGMGMMGQIDFARRGLDFFIKRYNSKGYLTTGYTMMGTGWHLWTLAEHFDLTADRAWLSKIAPEVARVCTWIARQRAKTKRLDAQGHKVPQHGLTPPGVVADWARFTWSTFQESHYCAGLREATRVLGAIGHPDAKALAADAREYSKDILRAYRWTQARTPAVRLGTGAWVPAYPPLFFVFGNVGGFFPGEDGSRAWAKNAMAHHLVANGIIAPHAQETTWMLDHMEDVEFLRTGLGDYTEEGNRKDWFNLGGFNKSQPYYRRNAEIYALRDDVKPFIRSYFNTLASLVSRENLSLWEHFHNRGGWNKTHETGWFLCQSRIMLLTERDRELWLAPFVTRNWLKDGMKVAVSAAPTRFGTVGYTITSATNAGHIDAVIQPPVRTAPRRIVLRLRHPDGKPMRAVTVDGKPHRDFDPKQETVTLKPSRKPITVRATY